MSRDLTFKENLMLKEISNMPAFGTFCAKFDKNEIFLDNGPKITETSDKIDLYHKLLKDHIYGDMNYSGANCVDVATFLIDYLNEMNLLDEPNFSDLKDTLEEMKNNGGTLNARETFKFVLNYSIQIGIIKDDINVER